MMMSTPSFMILLHTNIDPSTEKVWEVIKIITTSGLTLMLKSCKDLSLGEVPGAQV
jgi:hypothetical protein